ncbi:unnamed protein product [Adineta steineri]|uniref:PARP catalytic domain-containing protein n=1 Tax=Adineta steineri TaxID=433720 RepID=A0A819M9E0_9BILA|nr:unnamed protein product [Adineta steineri]
MSSDSDYDDFDYNSSQNSLSIDYQIDQFEFHHCIKSKKTKQKIRKASCSVSRKTLKSQPTLLRVNCIKSKITAKAERKPFRYDHYVQEKQPSFECDEEFQETSTLTHTNLESKSSKRLTPEHRQSFSSFRRYFYQINQQEIKSSLEQCSQIKITNIRLASVDEHVQKDFMKQLNNTSYFPNLVYHGTALKNITSILHYGLLIPNQAHPSNSEAPIIKVAHGKAYGNGIYCSQTAVYSLTYTHDTNTILICAAMPKRNKSGMVKIHSGNILVVTHVSRIIPLFLLDVTYLNQSNINHPCFDEQKILRTNENTEKKKKKISADISRKYLRKILNCMNDENRKHEQYQERSYLTYFD